MVDAPITLLVVDGHHGVRDALADRLARAAGIGAVHVAATLEAAMLLAHEHTPQVVLFDPRTVDGDPAATVRLLTASGCRVVVFTSSLLAGEAAALTSAGSAAIAFKGLETAALIGLVLG